jgi:hypothetical protein
VREFPSELCPEHCGQGVGIWQLPNQLAPALLLLSQFKIQSYVEVGCGAGGTFMFITEFLRKTNSLQGATCVDTAMPGANIHLTEEEGSLSPFQGVLEQYLRSHPGHAGFFSGTATQYDRAHPQGPAPGVDNGGAWYWGASALPPTPTPHSASRPTPPPLTPHPLPSSWALACGGSSFVVKSRCSSL